MLQIRSPDVFPPLPWALALRWALLSAAALAVSIMVGALAGEFILRFLGVGWAPQDARYLVRHALYWVVLAGSILALRNRIEPHFLFNTLATIRRLRARYGERAHLDLASARPNGVRVTIRLPFQTVAEAS